VHKLAVLTAVAALAVVMPRAAAQFDDEVPLGDVIEVVALEREIVAIDARTDSQRTIRLKPQEKVVWSGAKGEIGVVLTGRRALAISAGAAEWQELSYGDGKAAPYSALLGDRVALILTGDRVIGFNGHFAQSKLDSTERVVASQTGGNVGVVVTAERALGLSPSVGFVETPIEARERIESVLAGANVATVTSDERVRVFRAPSASWEVRRVD
jgi:hypothetical protein